MPTAFVAGATGYTGRNVVASCVAAGLHTVGHVRPDSSRLASWTERFEGMGATADSSPWTAEGMEAAMLQHRPDLVFALLGTTASRKKEDRVSTYEAVDRDLTLVLLGAAAVQSPRPVFVYLSAMGANKKPVNAYMKARVAVEATIHERGVPHVIARPAFITGDDRGEPRLGETLGASVTDGLLSLLGALGAKRARGRYGSITGPDLARALVALAMDPDKRGTFEAEELRLP